jgi:DNA polymerase
MRPFIDADYSAIEARIVCWLAGQHDALDEYRMQDAATDRAEKERLDRYRIMAALIFSLGIDAVEKFPHRFIGKEAILGCGFGLWVKTFVENCERKGKFKMDRALGKKAVTSFREKHGEIVSYWRDIEDCAKRSIKIQDTIFKCRSVSMICAEVGGVKYLFIKLPSGRKLAYPRPKVSWRTKKFPVTDENGFPVDPPTFKVREVEVIEFYGHIKGKIWGTVDTYGGKLVENITQAVAADIMAHGAHSAEKAGYQIATMIHDQALAYYLPGNDADEFVKLLTSLPAWAEGLPLAAEGGLVQFYKKD